MNNQCRWEVKADLEKNILIIKLEGYFSDEKMKEGADLVCSEANKLSTGFSVINDISEMKPGSPAAAEEIKRAQQFVMNKGVSKIVRITKNPITKMQFNRTSEAAGYHAMEAESIESAMKMLHMFEYN